MPKLSKQRVTIIGQGYVGLPLAFAACESGYEVLGLDNNITKVNSLNLNISYLEDISSEKIKSVFQTRRYNITNTVDGIPKSDIIVICVPTPLNSNRLPDLSYLKAAVESTAKIMKPNSLIIVESTVEPGTTRNIVVPLLEENSGFSKNEFDIAYSPERVDPTNVKWNINNTPKLVSGYSSQATERATAFYSKFIETIVECETLEIAETAKLLENSFRLVNISFINELSIFCQKLGIDINQVIYAASTKPYGFIPFYPSIGVGGHCIPVDPWYLANKAQEIGAPAKMINLADQINQEMPGYFVGRAEEALSGLRNKKVLVVGVSYKADISDTRESPAQPFIESLKELGAEVSWHDPLVSSWNGESSSSVAGAYDLAVVLVAHSNLSMSGWKGGPIFTTNFNPKYPDWKPLISVQQKS